MLNHTNLDSQLNALLAAPAWYVGFSGGADSTVLLHLLHSWCAEHPEAPPLSAIHINHEMQSAAPDWQRHCEEVCRTLALPLLARTVAVRAGGSGEAAARDARYREFERHLPPGGVLFLGHHLDDQVETVFLRLMRGAGAEGLAGIPRSRSLGEGLLLRPLLDSTRSEIEDYATHYGLGYVVDPSNSDTAMDRNFLRAEVLPLLASRWPAYRRSVARAAAHLAATAVALADALGVPETIYSALGDPGLALAPLVTGPEEVAATRLRVWLRAAGQRAPDSLALTEFLRQLRVAAVDGGPRLVSGSFRLQRYREGVYLLPEWGQPPPADAVELAPGMCVEVPGVGAVSVRPASGAGLRLAPGEILTLHWRSGGEQCHLLGRRGSRSLKAVMQECAVPPWWRDRVPLVSLQGELLAAGDLARCESRRWQTAPQESETLWNLCWERPAFAGSD